MHVTFSARDIEALTFIGEGFEVLQYQLHEAVFVGRSEFVVSRFVRRWAARGVLAIERWNGIGANRLRLTPLGRSELVRCGGARDGQLFAPRQAVALKDLMHTCWINDLRVLLRRAPRPFDVISAAWTLQRNLVPPPPAIPDLLALRASRESDLGFVLACEVDLGGERVKGVFAPKLVKLASLLGMWAAGAPALILVLTRGERRAAILRGAVAELEVPTVVDELPGVFGRAGLRVLRDKLQLE